MNIPYNYANLDTLVSSVIYGYYTKYERLIPLINENFVGSTATTLDIFVDVMDIFRRLDKASSKNSFLTITNPLVVTSGIINMIAHYRYFFRTRYRCETRFWLISSKGNSLASMYYPGFKVPILSTEMYKLYTQNVEFIAALCNNIHNAQFEYTDVDFVTKSIGIRAVEGYVNPAILISKDPFTLQGCATPNTLVLRPKKNNTGDISTLSNIATAATDYINAISNNKSDHVNISACQLSLLMALTRVPSRGLQSVFNIPTAIKYLNSAYIKNATTSYPWDIDSFMNIFVSANGKLSKDPFEIISRFKACDTVFLQYAGYENMPEAKLYKGIVNLYDADGMKRINEQYFKDCPLDLNAL